MLTCDNIIHIIVFTVLVFMTLFFPQNANENRIKQSQLKNTSDTPLFQPTCFYPFSKTWIYITSRMLFLTPSFLTFLPTPKHFYILDTFLSQHWLYFFTQEEGFSGKLSLIDIQLNVTWLAGEYSIILNLSASWIHVWMSMAHSVLKKAACFPGRKKGQNSSEMRRQKPVVASFTLFGTSNFLKL